MARLIQSAAQSQAPSGRLIQPAQGGFGATPWLEQYKKSQGIYDSGETPTERGVTNSFAEDARRFGGDGGFIPTAHAGSGQGQQSQKEPGLLSMLSKAGVAAGRAVLQPVSDASEVWFRGMYSPQRTENIQNAVDADAQTVEILERRKQQFAPGSVERAKLQAEIARLHMQDDALAGSSRAEIPSDRQGIGASVTLGLTAAPFVTGALGMAAPGAFGANGAVNASGLGTSVAGATAKPVVGQVGFWGQAFKRAALNTGPLIAAYAGGDAAMKDASGKEIAKRMALSWLMGTGMSLAGSGLKLWTSPKATAARAGVNPKAVQEGGKYPESARETANMTPEDRTQMGRDAVQLGEEKLDYRWKEGERKLAQAFRGKTVTPNDRALGLIDDLVTSDAHFADDLSSIPYKQLIDPRQPQLGYRALPLDVNQSIDLNTAINGVLKRTGESNPKFGNTQYLHKIMRQQSLDSFGGTGGMFDQFLKDYGDAKTMLDGLGMYFGERGKFDSVTLQSQMTAENNLTRLWRQDKDAAVRALKWLSEYVGEPDIVARFAGPEIFNAESAMTPAMRDMKQIMGMTKGGDTLWGDVKGIVMGLGRAMTSSPWAARNSTALQKFVEAVQGPTGQLLQQQGFRAIPHLLAPFIGDPKPRSE